MSIYEKVHFGIIRFVHETLFGVFVNPYDWLGQTGIARDQNVLEVGCGPGFFTIPAAKLVGDSGHVWSLDNNPVAVDHVRRKILRKGVRNVDVMLADAFDTRMPDRSFDTVFLYGVVHALWQRAETLILEMHRITKVGGILSISKSPRLPQVRIVDVVEKTGLFHLVQKTDRVMNFERLTGAETS
jgi:ubiquinone/menaquinone biosynthesis C-methylase UbiE